jgi:hypothetical protein
MSVLPFRRRTQPVVDPGADGELVDTEFGPISPAEVVRLFGEPSAVTVDETTGTFDLDAS